MQTTAPEKIRRFRCPGCGADQQFEPREGCLTCPYCGRSERIEPAGEGPSERPYEEYLRPREERLGRMAEGALESACQTCGAVVSFVPPQVAGSCDFCGSAIVAQPRSADPLVAPEGVLPFKVTSEEAADSIRRWLSSLWFAPSALKRLASHEGVGGVYIPFWTFDAHTASRYEGERGEHYWVTEHYTETDPQGRSVSKTRQVRHTRWHPASGNVSRWFDDLLVPATRSLPAQKLSALEPWDTAGLVSYDPAYLSGYKAQRYQVDLPEGFELAKQLAAPAIDADVRRDIGGDEQRVSEISTAYSAITFKHLLLPVYVGAYRFRERLFQVVINGRTGEVQGERPYSFWKIFFFALAVLALVALAVLLFGGR